MIQTNWFGSGFKLRAAITIACQIVRAHPALLLQPCKTSSNQPQP